MATRPFFRYSTKELEEHFAEHPNDMDELRKLQNELIHREKPKAVKLRESVKIRIQELEAGIKISPPSPPATQLPLPGLYPDKKEHDEISSCESITSTSEKQDALTQDSSLITKAIDRIRKFFTRLS